MPGTACEATEVFDDGCLTAGLLFGDNMTFTGRFDRGLHHLFQWKFPVSGMHLRYALDHPGHTDRMVAIIRISSLFDITGSRLRGGINTGDTGTGPRPDRLQAATNAAHAGLYDRQHERDRGGSIECIASGPQYSKAGIRGQWMGTGDHTQGRSI